MGYMAREGACVCVRVCKRVRARTCACLHVRACACACALVLLRVRVRVSEANPFGAPQKLYFNTICNMYSRQIIVRHLLQNTAPQPPQLVLL